MIRCVLITSWMLSHNFLEYKRKQDYNSLMENLLHVNNENNNKSYLVWK
jgi:hypothetical protein